MMHEDIKPALELRAVEVWEKLCEGHRLPPAKWTLQITDGRIWMEGFFTEVGDDGRAVLQRWLDLAGEGHGGTHDLPTGMTVGEVYAGGLDCQLLAITDPPAWEAHQRALMDEQDQRHDEELERLAGAPWSEEQDE